MNIYSLKNKELMKLHNEFNKTAFGRRAKIFSMIPMVLCVIFILFYTFLPSESLYTRFGVIISLIGTSITQLIYGNMLKDYINAKKED